jgi:hypothetical protein
MATNRHDTRLPYRGNPDAGRFSRGIFPPGINRRVAAERAFRNQHLREAAGTIAAFFACVVAAAVISGLTHPPSAEPAAIPGSEQVTSAPM